MSTAATTLQRVRVHADGVDAATARLRLASLLASTALRPPGLPPAALLIVRRLPDPRPRTLELRAGGLRPPPEWEREMLAALERVYRSAARPAREAVPAGAQAVVFADRAEWLACLARDAGDGSAWTRWWWRGAPPASTGRQAVAQAWSQAPRDAPAALELLAQWREATRFVRTLEPATARTLALSVSAVHAAPWLSAALEPPAPGPSPPPASVVRALPGGRPAAPWETLVPEALEPSLGVDQQVVLGVLLGLRRAPASVRSAGFAAAARRWRAAAAAPRADASPAARVDRPAPAETAAPTVRREAEPTARPGPLAAGRRAAADATQRVARAPAATAMSPAGAAAEPSAPVQRPPDAAPPARAGREPLPPVEARPPARGTARLAPPAAAPPRARLRPGPASAAEAVPAERAPAAPGRAAAPAPRPPRTAARERPPHPVAAHAPAPLAEAVDTGLGGLFYLLNLATFLGLYGDFTTPRAPGIALDPWDYVTLLGARLLHARHPDPVWALLARLAGRRRGEAPGRGFSPPRTWRVPGAWLEPFDRAGTWRWSASGGSLRIVHPAGFPAVAVPRTAAPAREQLRAELRRLPEIGAPVRTALAPEPRMPLARWVTRLGAYARARLQMALAVEDPAPLLLVHRARVLVTPTRVDVEFGLAELPLAVRLAGLDRNPGWLPAAGRSIALHFT